MSNFVDKDSLNNQIPVDNQEILKKKIKKVSIIGISVIIVVIICIICTKPKYEQAEIDFYAAMSHLDAEKMYSLLPDTYLDYVQDNYNISKDEVIESMEIFFDEIDMNKNYKGKIIIVSSKDVDADAVYDDDNYSFMFSNIDLDIIEAKFMELKAASSITDYSIKIDKDWYSANNILFVESSIMYKTFYDIDDALDNWNDDDYDYNDDDNNYDNNNDYENDSDYDFDWDY